ncbi:hypothetical protein Ddc_23942 [Ditylenchus destructor]|nr:hypothetical protein Ddc_23942 [Ditylenchus destructor]
MNGLPLPLAGEGRGEGLRAADDTTVIFRSQGSPLCGFPGPPRPGRRYHNPPVVNAVLPVARLLRVLIRLLPIAALAAAAWLSLAGQGHADPRDG